MSSLRAWQLTPSHPLALQIAADARLSSTDYPDDQIWEITLGDAERPALTAQTQYGGRLGLASLVPMWWVNEKVIYQYQAYNTPPTVLAFAPGYCALQAKITPEIALRADFWVVDSHTLTARYSLKNTSKTPIEIKLDLIAFVAAVGAEVKINRVTRGSATGGLTFAINGRSKPLIVLEGGTVVREGSSSTKLSHKITIKGGGSAAFRWVHVGLPTLEEGFARADQLFTMNWAVSYRRIVQRAAPIPQVQTGDADLDAALGFGYHHLMQAFLKPTASLPHASLVAARHPAHGASRNGTGADYSRSWSGQSPTLAYLTALAAAPINPQMAKGIVENYLTVQTEDGWIDAKPGLAGQRANMLCMPILARTAFEVAQITGDVNFLRGAYPKLARFVNRWLRPDLDVDGDGFPEWQSEAQTGFPFLPTFAAGLPYGQHLDIRSVEAPDLAAYLLSELIALQAIEKQIGTTNPITKIAPTIDRMHENLEALWIGDRYAYRDRDSNYTGTGITLLDGGRGDEEHFIAHQFTDPQSVIVQIVGGVSNEPRVTLHLYGMDAAGQPVHEQAETGSFSWSSGRGAFTSKTRFAQLERVRADGLSRVYKLYVRTADLQRRDAAGLLPIWSRGISKERAAALVTLMTDPAHFWLPNGISLISAQDNEFDSVKTGEGGGIWTYWITLLGEGLLDYGYHAEAVALFKRVTAAQIAVLKAEKTFREFYHTSQPIGLGEAGHLSGLIPLHLFHRLVNVFILSPDQVRTGGAFAWNTPITIEAHGVTVFRASDNITIVFPDNVTVQVPPDAPLATITKPRSI